MADFRGAVFFFIGDLLDLGGLRPGSKLFIVFMYSFQKLWLKTSTRVDIW